MTKEELIKKFVELCGDLAISNDSVSEETVLNFINSIQSKENNGWIKIESEEDLPKKGTNCHFILKNGVCGVFVDIGDSEYLTLRNRGTHYQPIVKPKPPLY